MNSEAADRPPHFHGPRRVVYVSLGCIFVGLGVVGALFPVMPTTPFLLLASYFFVRSSPRLNDRLLRSPLLGPFLRDWNQHRAIRPRVKVWAVLVMLAAVTASIALGNLSWPMIVLLLVLAGIGLAVVLRLPVVKNEP